MSTAGGPRLEGIGRSGDSDIVMCMDAHDAGSYPGEPTTNLIPYYDSRNPALVASKFAKEALWTSAVDSTDVIAPDGSSTTTKAVTGTSGNSYFYSYIDNNMGVTMASSTTYTISVWAKTTSTASTAVSLAFQDRGNGNYNTSVKTITTEWQRFSLTITTGSGATSYTLIGWVSPTNSRTFYFWGWQVEQKAYATPYVVSQLLDPSAQGPSARPASVNLMIHGNVGTGQSFSDSSPSKHTITANGNVTHSDAQSKFSGGSIYFDGTGDYLSIPDSNDWSFGSGDFTVDAWIYVSTFGGYHVIMGQDDDSTQRGWHFRTQVTSGDLLFRYSTTGSNETDIASSSTGMVINTWYHVAFVRASDTYAFYVNGVQKGSGSLTATFHASSTTMMVGARAGADLWFEGYMDEARVTKGTALWTAAFTPPTRRNLSAPVVDRSGNDNGGNFATTDMTDVATYRVGEVIEPIASAVWDFDGTDDYMRGGPPAGQVGSTTAKTYEYWFKLNSSHTSSNGMLSMQSDDANNYKWQYVYVATNTHLQFMYGDNSGYNLYGACSAGITADVWTCIVMSIDVSRAANDRLQIYRNGEPQTVSWNGTYTSKNAFYDGADLRQYIGAWNHASPPSPSTFLDGQMGKVSIWKIGLTAQQVKENFNQQRSRFGV